MENAPLEKVQDCIYSIFVEFDRICRKHNIKYSMEGGTLMGAVKYRNYVPWDDYMESLPKEEDRRPSHNRNIVIGKQADI